MSFLYYVPGDVRTLPDCLDYAFDVPPCSPHKIIANGPDGGSGHVFFSRWWGQNCLHRVGYYADKQTWRKIPGTDAWAGYYNDKPPTPDTLKRDTLLPGYDVLLGDGNMWHVPVARTFIGGSDSAGWAVGLPRQMDLNDNGEWVMGAVIPKYAGLWEVSTNWFDIVVAAIQQSESDEVSITAADEADWAVEILSYNYTLGKVEAAMLGLLNDVSKVEILNAAIDLPGLKAHQKKSELSEV